MLFNPDIGRACPQRVLPGDGQISNDERLQRIFVRYYTCYNEGLDTQASTIH